MSNNLEWRPIRKFPGYEVSATLLVRYSSTNRLIPQRRDPFKRNAKPVVIMHRNGWNTECFVEEMYLLAFPEKRAEYYQKEKRAA